MQYILLHLQVLGSRVLILENSVCLVLPKNLGVKRNELVNNDLSFD